MAQYGQGFYGEMYYGVLGAKYGTYTTNNIQVPGQMPFQGDMCIVVSLEDIKENYKAKATSLNSIDVFAFETNWIDNTTNYKASANAAVCYFNFTGSNCSLVYSGGPINYSIVTTDENGNKTTGATGTLPSQSVLTEVAIPTTVYTNYSIKLECPINTIIDSGYVFVCGTKLDIKAGNTLTEINAATYASSAILSQTVTLISGNKYLRKITYDANVLKTKCIYKYMLTLLSSDSEQQVWVDKVEVESLNPELYMKECTYIANLDIKTILGDTEYANMTEYDVITWTETVPTGTTLEVRTSAGGDLVNNMSAYTPIYRLGGYQARLKPGETRGWITTKTFDFNVMNGAVNTTISAQPDIVTIGYSLSQPEIVNSYGIKYSVMVNGSESPMNVRIPATNKDVSAYNIKTEGKLCQVVVEFVNIPRFFSPTVDLVSLKSKCIYDEVKTQTGLTLSAVEEVKDLVSISSLGFKVNTHPYIDKATYKIHSASSGENGYKLYFKSTSGINKSDTVVINKGANDTMTGYSTKEVAISNRLQNVRFGDGVVNGDNYTLTLKMINNFKDPSLQNGLSYLFRIKPGVVDSHLTGDRYVLSTDNTTVDADTTFAFSNPLTGRSDYTTKSIFNGSDSNDTILLTTMFNTDVDSAVWTSEEKVFNGSINVLGDKEIYTVDIDNLPDIDTQVFINNVLTKTYAKDSGNNDILQELYFGQYRFKIIENSVYCTPKIDSNIPVERDRIKIKDVSLIPSPTALSASAILIRGAKPFTDGTPSNSDQIPSFFINEIKSVTQTITDEDGVVVSSTTYPKNVAWTYDSNSRSIVWSSQQGITVPALNTEYAVEYSYTPYTSGTVSFECDYNETLTEKGGWASLHSVGISGTTTPSKDDIKNLSILAPKIIDVWPDIDEVTNDSTIDSSTLRYFIYACDNDFVNCTIKDSTLTASMEGLNPEEDWMLKIKGGYYYLGEDEYFLYNYKTSANVDTNIPVIANCEYGAGAIINSGAIISHDEIVSVALNNDFSVSTVDNSRTVVPTSSYTFDSTNTDAKAFWI